MKVNDILLERSLSQVNFRDMERFKKNQQWDDIDSNDIDTSKFDEVKAKIGQFIRGGKITIFRAEAFVGDYVANLEQKKVVGQFWSFDPSAAQVFRGKNAYTEEYLLVAEIKEEYIDWDATLSLHTIPHRGNVEREIRLFKNTPVRIKAIYKKDPDENSDKIEQVDLGYLKYMYVKARSNRDRPTR